MLGARNGRDETGVVEDQSWVCNEIATNCWFMMACVLLATSWLMTATWLMATSWLIITHG